MGINRDNAERRKSFRQDIIVLTLPNGKQDIGHVISGGPSAKVDN